MVTTSPPRVRAFLVSAAATRNQFFFEGNKRTSKLLATGIPLSHGYDGLSVPVAAREEYNTALDILFAKDNARPLAQFYSTLDLS